MPVIRSRGPCGAYAEVVEWTGAVDPLFISYRETVCCTPSTILVAADVVNLTAKIDFASKNQFGSLFFVSYIAHHPTLASNADVLLLLLVDETGVLVSPSRSRRRCTCSTLPTSTTTVIL